MDRTDPLTPPDRDQLERLGIPESEIHRQLNLFRNPPPPVQLIRACRPGDGVLQISQDHQTRCLEHWQSIVRQHKLAKFVPASGAATRMFKDLIPPSTPASTTPSPGVKQLIESLPRFAFFEALQAAFDRAGLDLDSPALHGDPRLVAESLLESPGLGYGSSPKALILFHRDFTGARSALEEQLWEGAAYLALAGGTARFHFTVTASHEEAFRHQIDLVRSPIESQSEIVLETEFSTQSSATDTIAVDLDNRIIRHADGSLLLRPAGHGALLRNLQEVDADIVFVKNIDNVAHPRLHSVSAHWKKVLAGYFAEIQAEAIAILDTLENRPDSREAVDQALALLHGKLALEAPASVLDSSHLERRVYCRDRLDRPLRVCGMVKNEGEPGGGPFWLAREEGGLTGQIVESAQVDLARPEQAEIWQSSTHFNPVDLVCGLRDRQGRPYPLDHYLDPATSFVAEKSHVGQPIKALERPGLWNGSMAGWNTAFVEVPLQTFTPVKTVFDLLRPEHQA